MKNKGSDTAFLIEHENQQIKRKYCKKCIYFTKEKGCSLNRLVKECFKNRGRTLGTKV